MSHPYTHWSNRGSSDLSISPRCSTVRYEMHLFESTTYGSTIAFVGHASRQAVHVPQKSSIGVSYSRSSVEIISPRNTHEPKSFVIRFVCFPLHPIPARSAQTLSITGPVST